MRLEALIRPHGFMRTEWPPELWEADTEDIRFIPLLGEMTASALSQGAELAELTPCSFTGCSRRIPPTTAP